jgi:tRNA dimethylallyltransferase
MASSAHPPTLIAVVGQTATGKSALAVALAGRLGGEIVNADAMQLYRGMDIGTAKTPLAERCGIPHHQLDVLGVRDEASLAAYQRQARADIAAIRSRGRVPVVVGGSGLYVRAVLDRLTIPPTDPAVREGLEADLRRDGAEALYLRLRAADPVAATSILPGNARRVVRALEVLELTGRPFSATLPTRELHAPTVLLGLSLDRNRLDDRIASRAARMWRDGLVQEVRGLLPQGLREGRTAPAAVGYRQALAVVDGILTDERAVADTAQATRRLARRQAGWFRTDPRISWLRAEAPDLLEQALRAIEDFPRRG